MAHGVELVDEALLGLSEQPSKHVSGGGVRGRTWVVYSSGDIGIVGVVDVIEGHEGLAVPQQLSDFGLGEPEPPSELPAEPLLPLTAGGGRVGVEPEAVDPDGNDARSDSSKVVLHDVVEVAPLFDGTLDEGERPADLRDDHVSVGCVQPGIASVLESFSGDHACFDVGGLGQKKLSELVPDGGFLVDLGAGLYEAVGA